MKGFVYILKSIKDNKKYIGSTIDLKRRFHEHNHGLVESTRNRKPFILAAYRKFDTIEMASMYEKNTNIAMVILKEI